MNFQTGVERVKAMGMSTGLVPGRSLFDLITSPQELNMKLTSEHIVLRPFEQEDWHAVYEWDADPDVVTYLTYSAASTQEEARAKILRYQAQADQEPRMQYAWVIALPQNNQAVGEIDLKLRPDRLSATVAYRIHPDHRGRGYTTEALRSVMRFGFETLGLHRIKGTADSGNLASRRVLEKGGLRFEGVCRREGWRGQPEDTAHYALLDREWTGSKEPPFESRETAFSPVPVAVTAHERGDGNPYIEVKTPHLCLREFTEEDWQLLLGRSFVPVTNAGDHPLSQQKGLDEPEIRAYVQQTVKRSRDCPRQQYSFVVTTREDNYPLGAATLSVEDHRKGWVEYHASSDLLHRDCAAEALQALLHLGFARLGMERISTDCWADNGACIRVFAHSGMRQEAFFLETSALTGGKWRSFFSYAALSEEWPIGGAKAEMK